MTSPPFEMFGDGTARLGTYDLRIREPLNDPDGDRYVLEVTGNQRVLVGQQYLAPRELRLLRPVDLPNGWYMSMEQVPFDASAFRHIRFLQARKQNDQLTITVTVGFDYVDWHLPVSLAVFVEQYAAALSLHTDDPLQVEHSADEYGVSVSCSAVVAPDENLYALFRRVSDACLRRFRECIAAGYLQSPPKQEPVRSASADDAAGARWWVRHVVVPVLCSGAFAAVVVALLAFAG